jgi:hypothetical protein
MLPFFLFVILSCMVCVTDAHVAAWHKGALAMLQCPLLPFLILRSYEGMYCLNGTTPNKVDYNTNAAVQPLYQVRTLQRSTKLRIHRVCL